MSQHSYIRKISEDSKLRGFLSAHFDVQSYLRNVVEQNKSEECSKDINVCIGGCLSSLSPFFHSCDPLVSIFVSSHLNPWRFFFLEEVNEEIKTYITQHKDDLMSGMQDVAVLAERYRALSSSSLKLQKSVDRLKKEAIDSHELVRMKTTELERIHTTSTLIRQLRQFAHAKSQLDHLLQSEGELPLDTKSTGDVRQLATAAKVLAELEGLLVTNRSNRDSSVQDDNSTSETCTLHDIGFVAKQIPGIQRFGQQLRRTAQEKLIVTLKDRNQAAVATTLQVFYNLNCLPDIVLLAIDSTIRSFIAVTENAIELDSLAFSVTEIGRAHV